MTLDDFLNNPNGDCDSFVKNFNLTATRTYEVEKISNNWLQKVNVSYLISLLHTFNMCHQDLYETAVKDGISLYREFKIPKKSGGLRTIDAPNEALKSALRDLKYIFEQHFGALYHTNAFAYIHGRSTVDAVKKHQENDSKWYAKYDLHNFFGSTTPAYVMKMLGMIFPFKLVIEDPVGRVELKKALTLAFLNGGLPQGTPISPLITNLIMIPVDYKLANILRDYNKQHFVYTRYADDFAISSQYDFRFREIEQMIVDTLASFGAPFTINAKKTRYGSRTGRNWLLGVMVNGSNDITIGYKRKREFQTMLYNYAMDHNRGICWDKGDVQHMDGLKSYYKMIEGEVIDRIIAHVSGKVGVDIATLIDYDLGRKS